MVIATARGSKIVVEDVSDGIKTDRRVTTCRISGGDALSFDVR